MSQRSKRKYPTKKKTTTKEGKTEYQRQYMRDYRADKKQILVDENDLEHLRQQWPDAYELIFGKKKGGEEVVRERKFPTEKKTTTKEGKREYMKRYMAEQRKRQREALEYLQARRPDVYYEIMERTQSEPEKKGGKRK